MKGGLPVRALYRNHVRALAGIRPVAHRHDTVIVLASGPSGAGPWPTHPGVPVIAVNGAIDGLSWDPDYWITLDPSPVNQARFQNRRPGTYYYVAVNEDHGPDAVDWKHRSDFSGCHKLLRRYGKSQPADKRIIHIGNSGRAALQLALHMQARRIAVFGVDCTDEGHWYAPVRSENLRGLPDGLAQLDGLADIRFATTGSSRVHTFPKLPPARLLDWIQCN